MNGFLMMLVCVCTATAVILASPVAAHCHEEVLEGSASLQGGRFGERIDILENLTLVAAPGTSVHATYDGAVYVYDAPALVYHCSVIAACGLRRRAEAAVLTASRTRSIRDHGSYPGRRSA